MAKNDFGGRSTDPMGEINKEYEDDYNQGGHNTAGPSEIKNQPQHSIPGSWEKVGPTNVPKHLNKGDFKAAEAPETASGSNIVMAYLTVDSDEHATRFVKALFQNNLIAEANLYDGGFERTYLKLGRMTTEKSRDKLELTTTEDRVAKLIDYINTNNPTEYDYPVPDTVVLPVETGNTKFLSWVKKTLEDNKEGLHEEATDPPKKDDE